MKRRLCSVMITAAVIMAIFSGCSREKVTLTVAAAASLKNAFENDLIPAFTEKYPDIEISGVYDSSGKLQTQIEEGLDADVFFSAAMKLNAETIAVGDPESVPAGQYAREAFESLGIWDEVLAKASLGTNVTEVLTWVAEGSAQAGVVYATDAASQPKVKVIAQAPEGALQKPVIYPVAKVASSTHSEEAEKLLDFLAGNEAAKIFEKYGFTVNK